MSEMIRFNDWATSATVEALLFVYTIKSKCTRNTSTEKLNFAPPQKRTLKSFCNLTASIFVKRTTIQINLRWYIQKTKRQQKLILKTKFTATWHRETGQDTQKVKKDLFSETLQSNRQSLSQVHPLHKQQTDSSISKARNKWNGKKEPDLNQGNRLWLMQWV